LVFGLLLLRRRQFLSWKGTEYIMAFGLWSAAFEKKTISFMERLNRFCSLVFGLLLLGRSNFFSEKELYWIWSLVFGPMLLGTSHLVYCKGAE
jgi:hypothetical protein